MTATSKIAGGVVTRALLAAGVDPDGADPTFFPKALADPHESAEDNRIKPF